MNPTTIVINDPAVLAQLAQADGRILFQDTAGTVVMTVETVPYGKPPSGYKIPFTEEELERRRQVRTGRPLADIMRELEQGRGQ